MSAQDRGVMLITGASRGIGAATALRAAEAGWRVAVLYREREDRAHAVVEAIEARGGTALAVRADVGDVDSVAEAFDRARVLGPLRALVNNAGITGGVSRVADLEPSVLAEVLRINVYGAFLCAREAVRRMSTARGGDGGAIVNVSSAASQVGTPGVWVHYAASKGALDSMTIGLAREVASEGIRVNAIRPGLIDTEIHDGRPPGQLDAAIRTIPMGRIGTADEIAAAIVWLASDDAPYVTAALLDARGGL